MSHAGRTGDADRARPAHRELRHYPRERQIRKSFTKLEQYPKILIVTEKLLTGFDAPVLYAMYLDKPMRDHTLLQAIARVNRPYENPDATAEILLTVIFGMLRPELLADAGRPFRYAN